MSSDAYAGTQANARRAHTREGAGSADALPPKFIYNFFLAWQDVEEQIEALQESKKKMLAAVRSKFGRHQANAIKLTMRIALMDKKKREEEAIFSEMARHYIDLLDAEIDARINDV